MKNKYVIFSLTAMLLASCVDEIGRVFEKEQQLTAFSTSESELDGRQRAHKAMMDEVGHFFWMKGDYIWVKKGSNFIKSTQVDMQTPQKTTQFFFFDTFPDAAYTVHYTNSNRADQVLIRSSQRQSAPNNSEHFFVSGDCGVATATRQSDTNFTFKLEHKATYLKIYPYLAATVPDKKYKLMQITISAKNDAGTAINIAGTYDLDETGLSGTGNDRTIGLTCNNWFPLTKDAATALENTGCYVVMAPGEYQLSITYRILDYDALKTADITRDLTLRNFEAGKYNNIRHQLTFDDNDFTGYGLGFRTENSYYEWGAQEWYWEGYEAICPETPSSIGWPEYAPKPGELRYKDPTTRYENGSGNWIYPKWTNPTGAMLAPTYQDLFNLLRYGDAHADVSTPWVLYKANGDTEVLYGGMWFSRKRKGVIADYEEVEVGTTGVYEIQGTAEIGRPENIEDYFFLPAAGYYKEGKLYERSCRENGVLKIGSGFYWCGETMGEKPHVGVLHGNSSFYYNDNSFYLAFNPLARSVVLKLAGSRELGLVRRSMPIEY